MTLSVYLLAQENPGAGCKRVGFNVPYDFCIVEFRQFHRPISGTPEHPRISPVETKALHDLSTVDIKYKATPVNYKNPVSSYIAQRPVGCIAAAFCHPS